MMRFMRGKGNSGTHGRDISKTQPSITPIDTPALVVDSDMTHPPSPVASIEVDEVAELASSGKIDLKPDGFWFSKPEVVNGVSASFKAHYNAPYMNWTEVPKAVKERWFLEFQRTFTWKQEYAAEVRKGYEKKGKERLKDHVNKAAKVPPRVNINWMSNTIRAEFIRKRQDPKFRERSEKALTNRLVGQTKDNFDPGHRQGSISTIEVATRLAIKNNGTFPTASEVYEKTHSVPMVDGDNLLIGQRTRDTLNKYAEKLECYEKERIQSDPNKVYLEVVGGQKKGKVYGLGSASTLFFQPPISSKSTGSTYTPSMLSLLCSQIEECKRIAEECQKVATESLKVAQATQEKYDRDNAGWIKERGEYCDGMLQMQKNLMEISQYFWENTCNSSFSPITLRDPRDPSGGGSPCAT